MRFPFLTHNNDLLIVDSDLKTQLVLGPFTKIDTYFNYVDNHNHYDHPQAIICYTPDENVIILGLAHPNQSSKLNLNLRLQTQFRIRKVVVIDNHLYRLEGLILTCNNELYFFSLDPQQETGQEIRHLKDEIFDLRSTLNSHIRIMVLTTQGQALHLKNFNDEHKFEPIFDDQQIKIKQISSSADSIALLTNEGEVYLMDQILYNSYSVLPKECDESYADDAIDNLKPCRTTISRICQIGLTCCEGFALDSKDQLHVWSDYDKENQCYEIIPDVVCFCTFGEFCYALKASGEYLIYYDVSCEKEKRKSWLEQMNAILMLYQPQFSPCILNMRKRTKSARAV